MAFKLGSKDKQKPVVLSKEYLESRRGEDLKKFQDQAAALQQEISELEAKKIQTIADIETAEKDFEAWRQEYLKEIQVKIEALEAKKKEALEEIANKAKEIDDKTSEQIAIHNLTVKEREKCDDKIKEAEEILLEARKQKDEAAERWRKIQELSAGNTEILNQIKDAEQKSKAATEDLENKRHELIQIQGRIDAAMEDLENQRTARDEQLKTLNESISKNTEILARVDKFNQDVKAFAVKQAEYDAWQKDKQKLEEDLEARKRQADIRDKVQEQKAAELLKREENVAKLEKGAIK